jgi:hypothetical protein
MPGVPGQRGRVPKRSSERMGHRSKADKESIDKVPVAGVVEPPEADSEWHQIAIDWYESLTASGGAIFMEPSDWAAARYVAAVMTRNLTASKFNGQLFSGVWSAMNDLLTTEGARRRFRVELERTKADDGKLAAVSVIDEYRNRIV